MGFSTVCDIQLKNYGTRTRQDLNLHTNNCLVFHRSINILLTYFHVMLLLKCQFYNLRAIAHFKLLPRLHSHLAFGLCVTACICILRVKTLYACRQIANIHILVCGLCLCSIYKTQAQCTLHYFYIFVVSTLVLVSTHLHYFRTQWSQCPRVVTAMWCYVTSPDGHTLSLRLGRLPHSRPTS